MKNIKFNNLFALLAVFAIAVSCVKSDDFDVPQTTVQEEPNLEGFTEVPLESLGGQYEQERADFTYEETNSYVSGYVISSDEAGNFFEEIIIQDNPTNPTIGVRVLIDENPLFTRYEVGRKVFVKLDGLTLGISNGVLTLGIAGSNFIEPIPFPLEDDFILRSTEVAEINPVTVSLEELAAIDLGAGDDVAFRLTNLYVRVANVQFTKAQVIDNNFTYAAEGSDEFDGERILESCDDGSTLIFSTSTFADFKAALLPTGRGEISGILTKNFFGDVFNLVVNDPSTVLLTDENRCDPEPLFIEPFECSGSASGGSNVVFEEDFETFNAIEDYVAAGWTNVNTTEGSTVWEIGNFDNNNYAQITGFNTGETLINSWLVTPSINMDNTSGEALNMRIQTNFDNGRILRVLFSENFTGDVTAASWKDLTQFEAPVGPSGGFGDFVNVGPINLSCIDGTIHIAFLYEGSDPAATTRYHVDDIEISGN